MTDHQDGGLEIVEVLPEALAGERLDRIVSMLDGCSRSVAAGLIDEGAVRVDERVIRQRSFRVDTGMTISFTPAEIVEITIGPDPDVPFDVIYEDEHIVVINKPAGVVVHPGAGRPDRTLANGLVARFPEIIDVGESIRPGIVHRLDAETSGLLIVARSAEAYPILVASMTYHAVERVYAAVVQGQVADDRGLIDAPIARSAKQRTKMAVVADGREARTHYEVLARNPGTGVTWLRCELDTGRTHQIRVHLAAIGHSVIGDTTYGARAGSEHIGRVALHAHRLGFRHPITGEDMAFEAPLPDDMVTLLSALKLDGSEPDESELDQAAVDQAGADQADVDQSVAGQGS